MSVATASSMTITLPLPPSGRKVNLQGYEGALAEFITVIGELQDLSVVGEHAEIEKQVSERMAVVSRETLQNTYDKLAREEEKRDDVRGPDGSVLRYSRVRRRQLETIFGTIWVTRLGYHDRGTGSVFPMDEKLNLPPKLYSHELQERAATAVGQGSFDAAVTQILRSTNGRYPKRQIEEMAQDFSCDYDGF
jgi:hypothetical protein